MLIVLIALLCIAGVGFLFWQLKDSDRSTAEKLRIRMAHGADATAAEPKD